jgi:hypothetical protein
MKYSLDLWLNRGGYKGELDSTELPSEPNWAGNHLSQPGLSDRIRVHLSEPCVSEQGLSTIMSGAMSNLRMSGPHLSAAHLSELGMSQTMSECTVIAVIIRDHDRATLIRPHFSETISELHLSQLSGDEYRIVVSLPISSEKYWSSQGGHILLIPMWNQAVFGIYTSPFVDEQVSSFPYFDAKMFFDLHSDRQPWYRVNICNHFAVVGRAITEVVEKPILLDIFC